MQRERETIKKLFHILGNICLYIHIYTCMRIYIYIYISKKVKEHFS